MNILGFSNDANSNGGACLLKINDGKIKYITITDERLSRVKNSYFFPLRAIKYCCESFGVQDINEIDYFITDFTSYPRLQNTNLNYRKLETSYINNKFKFDYKKIKYCDHHLAHAASAFYPSKFEEAAILVVDGVGSDLNTNSLYYGKNGKIELIEKSFGSGIGMVYTAVTKDILGFGVGEEGKTMGLAPLGQNVKGEPILKLNPVYDGLTTDFSDFIERYPSRTLKSGIKKCLNKTEVTNEYYSKIAFDLQKETENCILHLMKYAYEKTGCKNICFSGGVALNCVTNSLILEKTKFKNLFIQPAASDTGVPFGLALWGAHEFINKNLSLNFENAFTGISYDMVETKKLLDQFGINYFQNFPLSKVAAIIADQKIVAWHINGSEFGPRSLGHRSILADPRSIHMKDILNRRVKHREIYRPFAPSVLLEKASEYFDLKGESPYMLQAPLVKINKKDKIPAVIHLDGTARVQTVSKLQCPIYYNLIEEFENITGIPVILNTSFNDNGEPIVESPLDSLLCFLRTDIDFLYLDGFFIDKKNILNINEIINKLDAFRVDRLKSKYIESLDFVCKDYKIEELKAYLKSYLPMASYYQRLHPYIKLQEILNCNFEEILIDEYHLNILKYFLPEEYAWVVSKVNIVNDHYSLVKTINKKNTKQLVILYHISIYIKNKNAIIFYEDKNMKKIEPLYELTSLKEGDLMQSNEYISSKNWDEFYKNINEKL